MSDYHVHHHVNIMSAPGSDPEVVPNVIFKAVGVTEKTETQEVDNPDGSKTFVYTESYISPENAKRLAAENPEHPIILLTYGHDSNGYEERIAMVFHGENGRLEVSTTTVTAGPIDDVLAVARNEEDLFIAGE